MRRRSAGSTVQSASDRNRPTPGQALDRGCRLDCAGHLREDAGARAHQRPGQRDVPVHRPRARCRAQPGISAVSPADTRVFIPADRRTGLSHQPLFRRVRRNRRVADVPRVATAGLRPSRQRGRRARLRVRECVLVAGGRRGGLHAERGDRGRSAGWRSSPGARRAGPAGISRRWRYLPPGSVITPPSSASPRASRCSCCSWIDDSRCVCERWPSLQAFWQPGSCSICSSCSARVSRTRTSSHARRRWESLRRSCSGGSSRTVSSPSDGTRCSSNASRCSQGRSSCRT